jgi:hypothetical protein
LTRLGLPSGGEAGPEGDYHLQYSGLCRSVLFVSKVKKAQQENITPIFWTLQKCIVYLCIRSKESPAGEHHFNILDSAEVHCLGLFNDEKQAQPGLSQEEKQAQQRNITSIF